MSTTRVVVIGAGMGGLAASLRLANEGLDVTLLERHSNPGGKMRTFEVAGRSIDAGPTVFTMRWVFEALFQRAGLCLEEHLNLRPMSVLARHSWVGSDSLDLFTEIDQSCAAIETLCGSRDADNYRQFAAKSESIFNTLNDTFMQAQRPNPITLGMKQGPLGMIDMLQTEPFTTLWQSLSKRFSDPRLRQLFARYATYCGSSPLQAPATLMLIAHVERAGVWQVDGGMHALAQTLLNAIRSQGVETRFDCGVARIEATRSGVNGVILESGERLDCNAIVFNGDTEALTRGLLGEASCTATKARKDTSLSAVTRCSVARTSGFPLAHHTVFFGNDYIDEFQSIFERRKVTEDPTIYVCAQDRSGEVDAAHPSLTHERLLSLVNAPALHSATAHASAHKSALANGRQQIADSEAEVHALAQMRMAEALHRHGLSIDEEKGHAIVTTPAGFAEAFPGTDGALYGRATHGWTGSFKRPGAKSNIPGLYLAGGSVHPGAGVPMAALSGRLAAERLLTGLGRRSGSV